MATNGSNSPAGKSPQPLRVALVGNPNTGKSTLFNVLAGMKVRTGNYPGVTIEKKIGKCQFGIHAVDLVDLPGTYSLAPRSPDELVAVEVLTGEAEGQAAVDAIICVVNATMLQRNLFLVSQLLELNKPTIVALNMTDVAHSRGLAIDVEKLSENLAVPVVAISASKRTGIDELTKVVDDILNDRESAQAPQRSVLPSEFHEIRDRFRRSLVENACVAEGSDESVAADRIPSDYLVQRALLDRGGQAEREVVRQLGAAVLPALSQAREELAEKLGDSADMECSARYSWSANQLKDVLAVGGGSGGMTDVLDSVLTHRVWGLVIFVALMFGIFQAIYTLAGYPMEWIDAITSWIGDAVSAGIAPGVLRSLIVDGVVAGVGGVVIFVPQIALLFLFLAVLEDCGYMSRAAFLVDRIMALFGLSGKAFLPLMSSFACAVPGVMATRVIENRRDRFATMMVAPLMSCSARLPVYLLMIGAFIPGERVLGGWISLPAIVLMAMYGVGVLVAIPVAWMLKRSILKGETAPFVLELPEYKIPGLRVLLQRVWEAVREFVVRAGTLIFAASILIWFAGFWPGDHQRQFAMETQLAEMEEDSEAFDTLNTEYRAVSANLLENSLLGKVGHGIEPIVRPLGWDWKIGVGALASFPAREVIISTLGTIYSLGGDVDESDEGLMGAIKNAKWPDGRPVYTIPVALSVMVFFALCAQCVSTLLVIKRETNSWTWPVFSFTYMTVLAYVGSFLTYQIGSRLF